MSIRAGVIMMALCVPIAAQAQDTTRTRRDTTRRDTTMQRDTTMRRDTMMMTRQDTGRRVATSDRRIPVQKDVGTGIDARAEERERMERMRQDSIDNAMRMRQDSIEAVARRQADSLAAIERARADSVARIERARTDSIAAVERMRRDSVARADSIAREDQLRRQRIQDRYLFNGTGWYIGVSGGTTIPRGDFEDLGYDNGFNVTVPIGWHDRSHLLGVRLDLAYNQFGGGSYRGIGTGNTSVTLNNGEPKVLSAAFNVTARLPINPSRTVNLYGVGGAGIYHFRSFGTQSALSGFLGNDVLDPNDEAVESTKNKFGATFGGGIDFGVGPASLFVESRLVNVFADRDDNVQFSDFFGRNRSSNVRWVPIVLGVTFR